MASNMEDCKSGFLWLKDYFPTSTSQSYTILAEADIRRRQEKQIAQVSSTLFLSSSSSTLLLWHHKWNANKLIKAWLRDESSIRTAVGVSERPSVTPEVRCSTNSRQPLILYLSNLCQWIKGIYGGSGKLICGICLGKAGASMISADCGHQYCAQCWASYIGVSIRDGPGCISLRCPHPSCRAAIDRSMVDKLSTKDDRSKYDRYLIQSYVDSRKKIKWCPSPGCEYAVELRRGGKGNFDVECRCLNRFCWRCGEEAHRPASCDTAAMWVAKSSSDEENTNWLLANSKQCPKCKRAIEKADGCMHMVCPPPCNFEFCWLCMCEWSWHGNRTGGAFACNKYEGARKEGAYIEVETKRRNARVSLVRYTEHYELWRSNHDLMLYALERVKGRRNGVLCELAGMEEQLNFVVEAWMQIVQCRRVLKWSYVFGYSLQDHERAKRRMFDHLVGEAELVLKLLEQGTEEISGYIDKEAEATTKEFDEFRNSLTNLICQTGSHFKNLVRDFESGLQDVVCVIDDESDSSLELDDDDINRVDRWICDRCTFANRMYAMRCEMCADEEQEEDSDDDMGFDLS